ncbi:unnamed protein product [Ixodes persulcatus]
MVYRSRCMLQDGAASCQLPRFQQTKETRDAAFGARLPVFTAPLLVFQKHKGGEEAYMTLVSLTCQQ